MKKIRNIFLCFALVILIHEDLSFSKENKSPRLKKSSITLVVEAQRAKKIDLNKASLYKVYSIFNRKLLPVAFQSDAPIKCGASVLGDIYKDWDKLNEQTKSEIKKMLSPFQDKDFFRRVVGTNRAINVPTPPPTSQPLVVSYGYAYGHFIVFWTTTGTNALAYTADRNNDEDWQGFTDWDNSGYWTSNYTELFTDWDTDGTWDFIINEPFTDWNTNNIYDSDLDEFTDWDNDGNYDNNLDEPFTDWNGNGSYDASGVNEPFTDYNNSNSWDSSLDEPFTDWDNDGGYDSQIDEPFTDSDNDGKYDVGEPFTDYNGNGTRNTGLKEPFTDYNSNGTRNTGIKEPLTDYNGDGDRDTNLSEPFTDYNGNGSRNTGLAEPAIADYNGNNRYELNLREPFTDYNGNGVRETNLSEPFTDTNNNGTRDANVPEPLNDDVGSDGVANTGDTGEGDGNPQAGEPLIVDVDGNGLHEDLQGDVFMDLNGDGIWQQGEPDAAPDYVESFARYFQESWDREVGAGATSLGYDEPPGTQGSNHADPNKDGPYYYVFIQSMNAGTYGVTEVLNTLSGTSNTQGWIVSSYIIVNRDFIWANDNGNPDGVDFNGNGGVEAVERKIAGAMKVTAAHEFFHAVQGGYDRKGDTLGGLWWHEATATWMEDIVYNDVNDYRGYIGETYTDTNNNGQYDSGDTITNSDDLNSSGSRDAGWFDEPETRLNYANQFHEYGTTIFAKFLSERTGGSNNTILSTWSNAVGVTEILSASGNNWAGAIPTALGSSAAFQSAFKDFTVANYRKNTSYADGNLFPQIKIQSVYSSYPASITTTSLDYLSSLYYKFKPSSTFQTNRYRYTLYLRLTSSSTSSIWGARVILIRNDGTTVQDEMNCNTSGIATYSVTNFGTTYTEVVLIPSNIGTAAATFSVAGNFRAVRYQSHSMADPTKTTISTLTKAKIFGQSSDTTSTVEDWFGNGDGNLDAGEGPDVKVTLKNIGTIDLEDAKAKISKSGSVTNASIEFLISDNYTDSFGTITPDGEKEGAFGYWITKVSPDLPKGSILNFDLDITEKEGTDYPDSFTITSDVDINLKYGSHSVKDNQNLLAGEYGNNNSSADAGELISVPINLKNDGYSYSNNITAVLSTTSPYAKIYDTSENYGNIGSISIWSDPTSRPNPKQSADNYNILIASDAAGQTIPLTLTIADNNVDANNQAFSNTYTSTLNIAVSGSDVLPPVLSNISATTKRDGGIVAGVLRDGDKVNVSADVLDGDLIDSNGVFPTVTGKVYDSNNVLQTTFDLTHGSSVPLDSDRYGDSYAGEWTIPVGVNDGSYTVKLTSKDNYGNEIPLASEVSVLTREIDTKDPIADISEVSPNYGTNSSGQFLVKGAVTIKGKALDRNFKEYKIYTQREGEPYPGTQIFPSTTAVSTEGALTTWQTGNDGIYTLRIIVEDSVGHQAEDTMEVYVDNTPPTAFITTPGFSGFPVVLTSGEAYIYGIVDDPHFKEYTMGFATGVPPSTSFTDFGYDDERKPTSEILAIWHVSDPLNPALNLDDGNYTIRLTATDVLGNQNSVDRAMTIDRIGPQITILSDGSTNVIQYDLSESGSTNIAIKIPGLQNITLSQEAIQGKNEIVWDGGGSSTPTGTYDFDLIALDDAKNENIASGKVTKTSLAILSTDVRSETQPCCTIALSLSKDISKISLKIVNKKGADVNQYNESSFNHFASGQYEFLWDGKNKYGQLVESSQNGSDGDNDYGLFVEVTDDLGNKASTTRNFRVDNGVTIQPLISGGSSLSSNVTPPSGTWPQGTQLHIKQRNLDLTTIADIREELRVKIRGEDSRDRPAVYRLYTYLEAAKNADTNPSAFVWDGKKQDGNFYTTGEYEYDAFDAQGNILSLTLLSVPLILSQDNQAPTIASTNIANVPDNTSFTATLNLSENIRPYVLKVYDSNGNFIGSDENRKEKDDFEVKPEFILRKWTPVTNTPWWESPQNPPLSPDVYTIQFQGKDVAGNLATTEATYEFKRPIDPAFGGIIKSPDAHAWLIVPPGALQTGQLTDLSIAEDVAPPFGEGFDFLDKFYDYQPDGITFKSENPAILRLYYDDADGDGKVEVNGVEQDIAEEDLAIYNFDPTQNEWIRLGGITNRTANYLEIPVFHVSLYALVYPKEQILPVAQITSPTENQVVEGVVNITGTATDANFTKYRLMVGEGTNPTTWTVLADSPSSVNNGTLASWDTKGLSGTFVIRLDAWDKSNNHAQDAITVSIKAIPTDTTPPSVSFVTVTPTPFSPNGDGKKDTTTLSFYLSEDAYVTVGVYGSPGNLVRNVFTANAFQGTQNIVWDGKDDFGSFVFNGTYTLKTSAQDVAGNKGTSSANVTMDTQKPVASVVQVNPTAFSPNNDGIADTVTFSYTLSEGGYVTANVVNSANNIVYRFFITPKLQPPQVQTVTWDGTGNTGEGLYSLNVQVEDLAGNVSDVATGQVLLDFGPPEIKNVSDAPDPFSPNNATSSGEKDINTITADITEASNLTWDITIKDAVNTLVRTFTGTTKTLQQTWDGKNSSGNFVGDGTYMYIINATDVIGNKADPKSGTVYVDNTSPRIENVSASPNPFSPNNATSVGVKDTVQIQATVNDVNPDAWQVTIKDESSQLVRTYSGAGANLNFTWDGKNSSGSYVSDGMYTLSFSATDTASNKGSAESTVSVDNTNSVTTLSFGTPNFESGGKKYITSNTPLTLSATDPVINSVASGLSYIQYRIDGGSFVSYTTTSFFLVEGIHTVEYQSIDNVGNKETLKSETFHVDNTPSVTTFVIGQPQYVDARGTFITPSTPLTFTATDPVVSQVASGVKQIQYRIDGQAFQTYTSAFFLTEGIHTIEFFSTDNLGNQESTKSFALNVDNTPPVTTLTVGNPQYSNSGKLYVSEKTTLSLTAFDPVVQSVSSGVSVIQYRMDGGNWNTYVSPFTLPEGVRVVEYRSIDNVQNTETAQSITLHVDGTTPETSISIGTPQCTVYANPVVTYVTPFTLTPVDPIKNNVASGVNFTQYRLNSGNWQTYTGNFTIPTSFSDGTITIDFRSQDNVENLETTKTQVVILDNASPTRQILSPQANGYVNNTIAVVGVVTDTYFADKGYYTVEYGSGSSPSNYTTIQPATYEQRNCNVDNPTCTPLTYWNTAGITQNQIYTVRLSTQDCVGNATSTQVTFKVGEPPFVLSFGTKSQGQQPNDGEFNEPAGLATVIANDGSENIAVSDKQNHRIQIFTDKGQFITKFGQKAHGQVDGGEFNEPTELVTDSFGNLYIVDSLDDRVQKFDKNYAFLSAYGSHGDALGQFIKPYGVARDTTGNLYVTDMQNNRVQKLDASGNFIKEWTSIKKTTNGVDEFLTFNKPGGILVDAAGNIFVSDSQNNRILKFTQDGTFILSIEATGQTQAPDSFGDHPLKQPLGMMFDNFGNLYVADQMNHRIQKFDPWGFRLLNFGTKTQGGGDPAGTFNQVADVLLDSTQKFIFVSDIYNHRVQRFAIVTDAPPVAKAIAQNQNKDTIIADPNLLTILKVMPYPTPSKGKLSFNLEAEGNVTNITLEVYTMTGKRVLTEYLPVQAAPASKGKGKFKAESPSLDAVLSSLPNGVYVYRLQISNGVKTVNRTGKFVVVK